MTISQILKSKGDLVHQTSPEKLLAEVVDDLVKHNIGSLLVVEDNVPVGIISERDILRFCSRSPERLNQTTVNEIMTRDIICAQPNDDADSVLAIMTQAHIRHVPVIDEGKVCGLVSIGDMVKTKLDERAVTIKYLQDYIVGKPSID